MGRRHLTLEKREILQRPFEQGHSTRSCSRILGYAPSTISKQRRRGSKNKDGKGRYDYQRAHNRAIWRRRRATRKGKQFHPAVLDYVRQGLKQYWSPEQICNRMKLDYPGDHGMRISFKTIYRWLNQAVASHHEHPFDGYSRYLRLKRQCKSFARGVKESRGRRDDLPSIEDRPKAADDRKRFGDWECDLIQGFRRQGYLVTLVERSTGLLLAGP